MKVLSLVLSMSLLLFAACSAYEKNEVEAYVTELSDRSFEVEVRFHGRAYNPHSLSFFPPRYGGASWLYLKAITGSIPASEVIVTSEKAKLTGYAADRFKVGSVSFSGDTMTVELEAGQYRSVYGHNGSFRLVRIDSKQKPNKAPEPTPGSVTPRATERVSK